jgi:isoleucyl-tRNA synthetase
MDDILVKKNEGMPNFPTLEEKIIEFWKKENILGKSIKQRDVSNSFTFYDGPITSNNKPHYGHALTMVIKDVIPRYKTMKGYHVDRSLGWDCQGIPVEVEVEKALGIDQKSDIEKFGIEKFNQLCRESVLKYQGDISQLTERMGRWVNKDEEYATMDAKYIESVWWSLKELYNKGLLYQGYKVVPYSTGAGTTLSNSEVALGGYKAIVDPAVTVKLKLKDEDTYLLIWTTTPWTLPGNLLVAVGKDFEYVKVVYQGEKYIVGKTLAEKIFKENYKVVKTFKGSDLIGKEYEPLYPYFEDRREQGAFRVVHADHVTLEDGTGLVHQAPYGEEDFALMTGMGIQMFDYLDDDGNMKEEITQFKGMFYKKASKYVMQDLEERNLLFAHEDYEHQMPMCWRTDTPLIYRPIKSWYVKVSELRKKMVSENNEIKWIPEHIKDGRFGNWLADARDWALSRSRYWGTPLPVWVCDSCGNTEVLGSFKEVEERSGVKLADPHKPFVDEVTYKCKCGGTMKRVEDVIDVWYDSGSMPFARFHYPFENEEKFKSKYPAQFIAEGVDQTRGWFYTLHVIGTALFDEKSFENVVVNGLALASDGTKMSKSKRNYTEVSEVLNQYGADAMRLYFLSSPIVHGEEVVFDPKYLKDITTTMMLPYWNSVKYFLNYSKGSESESVKGSSNIMDRWILARLTETQKKVNEYMDEYLLQQATNEISALIDDLSKWYIRSSRERFVNGEGEALSVLKYVLLELTKLLAPFAPFLTESVYLTLTNGKVKESVHLEDYPVPDMNLLDVDLISNMTMVRKICSLGLNIRDEKRIKVRQPLSKAFVSVSDPSMQEIIKNELNVKEIEYIERAEDKIKFGLESSEGLVAYRVPNDPSVFVILDTNISEELKEEGLFNEIQRGLQVARKDGGCKVGEYISVKYASDSDEVNKIIKDHEVELKKAVFIKNLEKVSKVETQSNIKVGEDQLLVEIIKS